MRIIKHECLNRVIPFGERHLRRTIAKLSASRRLHTDRKSSRGWTCRVRPDIN